MAKVNVIRSRLALLKMTQKELAVRIGISEKTMTGRMTGRSSFTLEEVDRICEFLGFGENEKADIFLS